MFGRWSVGLAALWGLLACSQALDWRDLRPEGWALQVPMPCRPASQARQVALAGGTVMLEMRACRAADLVFAAASAEVRDPAAVGPALQALAEAARANVDGRIVERQPAAVAGMTPHAQAQRWQLTGRLPDGQAVQEHALVFARGLRVYQVTVVGPKVDAAAVRPLFDGLKVLP